MFSIDTVRIKVLEADIKTFSRKALPHASKFAMNSGGFIMRGHWQENIDDKMIQRNKFTRNSIRVERTNSLNIRQQRVTVGSIAPYMADQEFGGIKRKKGSIGTPIATQYASGEGESSSPRKKLPTAANRIKNIKTRRNRRTARTKKQTLIVKVREAVQTGRRYIYFDFDNKDTKGIFKVVGGRRSNSNRGWPTGAKLKMIHDMSRDSVSIPKNPTAAPAVVSTRREMPDQYARALEFQAKRLGLFK